MPLDEFPFSVLRTLMPLRSPASVFAGGSVLRRHAFRLSDDQDIFHGSGEDVAGIALRDVEALRTAGFTVSVKRPYKGLVEAVVVQDAAGSTKIQWIESGSWAFFEPVPDPDFGWRLHMADLATNKSLAAGGRRQVRDYVDLVLIHRNIMPLWLAIWAAPGKNESWSPASLAEKIAMTNNCRQPDVDEGIISTIDVSAAEVGATVRAGLDEARAVFQRLPDRHAGTLFLDESGGLILDVDWIVAGGADIRRWRLREAGAGLPARRSTMCSLSGSSRRSGGTEATQPKGTILPASRGDSLDAAASRDPGAGVASCLSVLGPVPCMEIAPSTQPIGLASRHFRSISGNSRNHAGDDANGPTDHPV